MKSIRIQNLRSLEDTGVIELRPITVLVGENSSGKSTFLRAFPLFRQSVEVNKTGPILWFGKYVDFGSFDESVNAYSKKKCISFEFCFNGLHSRYRYLSSHPRFINEESELWLKVGIIGDSKLDSIINSCEIGIEDTKINLEFDENKIIKFLVNDTDFTSLTQKLILFTEKGILPLLLTYDSPENTKPNTKTMTRPDFDYLIEKLIGDIVNVSLNEKVTAELIKNFYLGSSQQILDKMKAIRFPGSQAWNSAVANWDITDSRFIELRDTLFASSISYLLSMCNEEFASFAENIRYIAPLRATAERYYRYQNLSVNEVDFQGQNLAMFLKNLSDTEKKKFSEWTEQLFNFSPQAFTSHGHVSIQVQQGTKFRANLADMGFGFSQVLPILTQLWQLGQRNIPSRFAPWMNSTIFFAVEQPELHLHPRMQSKLAIAFSNIIKSAQQQNNDVRLIIETHSDSMVNMFGRLVNNGELDTDDICIVLFEKSESNLATKVQISNFDDKGLLRNWPYGFFEPD